MRQMIRLVGMPDKVIAFDELPADLLKDLDMQNEKALPRYWREYIGVRKRVIEIKSYVDPMTRQLIKCDPLIEEGPFSWVVDWENNNHREAWSRIVAYVRANVDKEFRLLDRIEDMAKPLAPNVSEQITLEPEDVIVIPLTKEADVKSNDVSSIRLATKEEAGFKCRDCGKEFSAKRGVWMHRMKKHNESPSPSVAV